jgi:uncharacterized protein (DUF4213/DUF364 family)
MDMKILRDILNTVAEDAPIQEVRRGLHWNAVISKYCGLSSTLSQDAYCCNTEEEDLPAPKDSFTEMSAIELAKFSLSENITEASLGIAAINSLIRIDLEKEADLDGLQLVRNLGKGKNISIIGHFPFLDRVRDVAKNLWIIEKHPKPGDVSEEAGKEYLPKSDIVVISGTTLINHTLEGILSLCNPKSVRMMLGPSTPVTPILFDYGIDIVSGSRVTDKQTALKYISEGANFVRLKKTGSVRFVNLVKDREAMIRKLNG